MGTLIISIIIGTVLGVMASVGIICFIIYYSNQFGDSKLKFQEFIPQYGKTIITVEKNGFGNVVPFYMDEHME